MRISQDYPVVTCSQPEEVERALVSESDRWQLWSSPSRPLSVCPWVSDMAFLSLQNGNSLYQAQAKHFLCVNSLKLPDSLMRGETIIPILQMRKPRHRES